MDFFCVDVDSDDFSIDSDYNYVAVLPDGYFRIELNFQTMLLCIKSSTIGALL